MLSPVTLFKGTVSDNEESVSSSGKVEDTKAVCNEFCAGALVSSLCLAPFQSCSKLTPFRISLIKAKIRIL